MAVKKDVLTRELELAVAKAAELSASDPAVDVMIWKCSLWVQYHQYNEKAFSYHVEFCPNWLTNAYSKLTEKDVNEIFSLGVEAFPEHFNKEFIQEILVRRDQFLEAAPQNIPLPFLNHPLFIG